MRKQLILMGLSVAAVAGAGLSLQGVPAGHAAVFGGLITVVNLLLTRWHMRRAEREARADAARNLRILLRCAFERLVASVTLFAIGMIALKLPPLWLIAGFGVALAGQYLAIMNSKT